METAAFTIEASRDGFLCGRLCRRLLLLTIIALTTVSFAACGGSEPSDRRVRIALLHLEPQPGDLARNRRQIETATTMAAQAGADWIITPELAVTGYDFVPRIGSDWIEAQPDDWLQSYAKLAASLGIAAFVGMPEKDVLDGKLYNSLQVIDRDGRHLGQHRKIHVIPGRLEGWSTPGGAPYPVQVGEITVGMLICADAYTSEIADALAQEGAQFLLSAAAWMPGQMGPNGAWERRSLETGLPLVVCNRTGQEEDMDFTAAESVVIQEGVRVLSYASPQPALILIDYLVDDRVFDPASSTIIPFSG